MGDGSQLQDPTLPSHQTYTLRTQEANTPSTTVTNKGQTYGE